MIFKEGDLAVFKNQTVKILSAAGTDTWKIHIQNKLGAVISIAHKTELRNPTQKQVADYMKTDFTDRNSGTPQFCARDTVVRIDSGEICVIKCEFDRFEHDVRYYTENNDTVLQSNIRLATEKDIADFKEATALKNQAAKDQWEKTMRDYGILRDFKVGDIAVGLLGFMSKVEELKDNGKFLVKDSFGNLIETSAKEVRHATPEEIKMFESNTIHIQEQATEGDIMLIKAGDKQVTLKRGTGTMGGRLLSAQEQSALDDLDIQNSDVPLLNHKFGTLNLENKSKTKTAYKVVELSEKALYQSIAVLSEEIGKMSTDVDMTNKETYRIFCLLRQKLMEAK